MNEKEKQIVSLMTKTLQTMPEEKKQYVLGFIEGIASMAYQPRTSQDNQPKSA